MISDFGQQGKLTRRSENRESGNEQHHRCACAYGETINIVKTDLYKNTEKSEDSSKFAKMQRNAEFWACKVRIASRCHLSHLSGSLQGGRYSIQ